MRKLTLLSFTALIAGCPQPTERPDVTIPDVVQPDRTSVDRVTPPEAGPDVVAPMDMTAQDATMESGVADDVMMSNDAGNAGDATAEASMDAAVGPAAQIRAVMMSAAATAIDLPVENVLVTYVVPAITGATAGNDPAGFTVQADMAGPALFLEVLPSSLTPSPTVGDRVSFRVTRTRAVNSGMSRWVSTVSGYTRLSGANPVAPLTQDLSSAADIVSNLPNYEYELISLTGTITDNGTAAGSSFQSFAITTAGIPTADTNLRLRMPMALSTSLGARQGCRFTIGPTPLWRFIAAAQPSAWTASDIMLSMCPTAMDAGVDVADARADASDASDVADVRTDVADASDVPVPSDAADSGGCVPQLVINELQSRGVAAGDEFIEIFNAGRCAVNLEGWTVSYQSSSGTSAASVKWTGAAGQMLNAGQYGVIISGTVPAVPAGVVTLAMLTSIGMADTGGVGLFNMGTRVDSVTYQQTAGGIAAGHPMTENTPATSPAGMPVIIARRPNGADTNNNSVDFVGTATHSMGAANP
ncbi:MAG: lamin tail domain-containing protein [Deltaproteobacteria bacterium]|nr:lamin tail domain-containing protein [Deltaproteobacteria bacterium]